MLRVRIAYGTAGAQPAPSDPSRIISGPIGSTFPPEPFTHPEISRELEGGFDSDWLNGRLSLGLTAYRKQTSDALVEALPVVPSVGGPALIFPTADVRNHGVELTAQARLAELPAFTWSVGGTLSRNTNQVTRLTQGSGALPIDATTSTRIADGYPLLGRWARPLVGYTDANADGVIEASEIRLGDSAVYLGSELPRTVLGINTSVSLFNGRLVAYTSIEYLNGMSQYNQAEANVSSNHLTYFVDNDTNDQGSFSLAQQAAMEALLYTQAPAIQTVHVLRWSSLTVNYRLSPDLAHRMHVPALSLMAAGKNLGMHTNYHGVDPTIGALNGGTSTVDDGQLPLQRSWSLGVNVGR
jgi:hypothetical protein